MSGVNKVILVGRLGKDPETKTAGSSTVCKFSIATSEKWVKDGKTNEKTEWHNVVVWGKLAENCAKYLAKGREVFVEGKLATRSWEKDGVKRYATEIIAQTVQFLGSGQGKSDNSSGSDDFGPEPSFSSYNEDIPF